MRENNKNASHYCDTSHDQLKEDETGNAAARGRAWRLLILPGTEDGLEAREVDSIVDDENGKLDFVAELVSL
jgi:hypothetical protein